MEIKTIIIDKTCLTLTDNDNGNTFTIESENGSGLYDCSDDRRLTRMEIKKYSGNIDLIDDVLEKLKNKYADKVYTDDGLNFIDEYEFNKLKDEWKTDYYKVEYVIK